MIAETLYAVAKDLFGIFSKIDERHLKRTARTADYFSNLAQIIEDTCAYLRNGKYPHGECAELRFHAEKMVSTLGAIIGNEVAEEYAAKILSVWEIENMHVEFISLTDANKEAKLRVLDEASGFFRGVAAHLRVLS